jgi:hypothetical protein
MKSMSQAEKMARALKGIAGSDPNMARSSAQRQASVQKREAVRRKINASVKKANASVKGIPGNIHPGFAHYKPTTEDKDRVKRLVLLGSPKEKIAGAMGLSIDVLEKNFGDVLKFYEARRLSDVAGKAYDMALKGNPVMVQFVLRTRGRWRENVLGDVEELWVKRVIGVADSDI